jgi:hypothetical protein
MNPWLMPLPFNLGQRTKVGKNICAINELKQYGPKGPKFLFLLVEGGVLDFLLFPMCSHEIPNGLPTCSPSLQCVPQHVLNSFSLYPKSFTLSYILVTYISSQKEKVTTYLFWDCPKYNYFVW